MSLAPRDSDGGTRGCRASGPLVTSWAETRSGLHPRGSGAAVRPRGVLGSSLRPPHLGAVSVPAAGGGAAAGQAQLRVGTVALPSREREAPGQAIGSRCWKPSLHTEADGSRRHMAPRPRSRRVCHHRGGGPSKSPQALRRRQVTIWPGRGVRGQVWEAQRGGRAASSVSSGRCSCCPKPKPQVREEEEEEAAAAPA